MGQQKSKHLEDNETNSDEIGHDPYNTSIQRGSNEPRQLNTASEFNNREVNQGNGNNIAERLKKSEEEKDKLLQKISELENESRSGISKTEHDGVKKARDDLQKVHMLLVEQHTQLVSKDKKQQAQLSDLENQLEKMSTQYRTLMDEINSFKNVAEAANLAKKAAEDKLIMVKVNKDDVSHDLDVHWKNILKAKDQQIEKMKIDLDTAINEKEAIELSFQQMLSLTIENSEASTSYLEQKLNEVHMNCLNLKDQLDNKEKQILELQKQSSSLEKLNKDRESPPLEQEKAIRNHFSYEIVKLQSLLEKCAEVKIAEKKTINKIKVQLEQSQTIQQLKFNLEKNVSEDFSSQMSRLQALIEIGQEVLTSAEDMSKKLKAGMPETKVTGEIPSSIVEASPANLQKNINRRNKKRKFEDVDAVDDEEEEASEKNLVSDCSIQDADCQLCSKMEKNCSLNPIKINMNYCTDSYDKQLILVIDTNVIIDFVDLLCDFLSYKIDGCYPIVLIPYLVVKELDSIRKDKNKVNRARSIKCTFAMVKLEQCMRETTRVLEQSLEQMKISSIIEFKKKDADDTITECCVALKKSSNNVLLWTEDINLRIKVLGHGIPAVKETEILKILQHGTKNPLRKIMLQEDNLLVVKDILAQLPAHLILDMIRDPKTSILFLTEKGENFPKVRESEIKFEETRARATSLGDLNLDSLFETE